ncbi:MAG: hypothetical protein HC888_18205 [Candidatus Competibacteraceae bacterium]|nr:hypothetical protein [Candidatus Competibacteraceae bacterium]
MDGLDLAGLDGGGERLEFVADEEEMSRTAWEYEAGTLVAVTFNRPVPELLADVHSIRRVEMKATVPSPRDWRRWRACLTSRT